MTYTAPDSRNGSHDGEREGGRHDLGRGLLAGAEDVVDLLELAVAQGLLVGQRLGVVRGTHHRDVEGGGLQARGRPERPDHDGGLEGLGGDGELDGEVGLFLCVRQSPVSMACTVRVEMDCVGK